MKYKSLLSNTDVEVSPSESLRSERWLLTELLLQVDRLNKKVEGDKT